MDRISIKCSETDEVRQADVMERSDRRLRVAFVGSTVPMTLNRTDTRRLYTAEMAGREFTTDGTPT